MYGANEIAVDGDPQTDVRYIRITDIDDHGNLQDEGWKTVKNRVEKKYALHRNDLLFARSWNSTLKHSSTKERIARLSLRGI